MEFWSSGNWAQTVRNRYLFSASEGTTYYWRDFSFLSFPLPNEKRIL